MESSGQARHSSLERFGNYCLLYPLAYGGMAAIYLARTMKGSAGRILVVKRILPQIASDPMFLNMFRAEIRVCLELNHPNIVQVHDFGDVDGQPYIAMEYVEGKNLRELIECLAADRKFLPIGVAATVIGQAAGALHHAHTACSRISGEALGIIHRDVTPHNILISYAGNSKVIDFGVAKAVVDDAEKTRAGGIKGKVRYLSPEQIQGEVLDSRSDIFSLGIVLWESLTSRQLFGADSESMAARSGSDAARDFGIMKEIVNCDGNIPPPSRFNPGVPPELDQIALKALGGDREKRYQRGEDLQEDLRRFMIARLPGFSERAVADQMHSAFGETIRREQELVRELGQSSQRMLETSVSPPNLAPNLALVPPHSMGFQPPGPQPLAPQPLSWRHTAANIIPPGERGESGQLPVRRSQLSRVIPPAPVTIHTGHAQIQAGLAVNGHVGVKPQGRRGPQFLIHAVLATLFWSFAIWLSIQHHGPFEAIRAENDVAVPVLEPDTGKHSIRMALSSPPDASASVATKGDPRRGQCLGAEVAGRRPASGGASRVLRIAVEPASSVPTRLMVDGKRVDGTDHSVSVELGKNVALRVERPSFIPFEDHVTVTRKDVDRFGVARLTVHLREW